MGEVVNLDQSVAVGTFVNGCIVTFIAWQQHNFGKRMAKLEEAKYINDMFNRRFDVFRSTQELLSHVVTNASCSLEDVQRYTNQVQQSYFVFDDEMYEYLMRIRTEAIQLAVMGTARDRSSEPVQRQEFVQQSHQALEFLIEQISGEGILKRFGKYLRPSL